MKTKDRTLTEVLTLVGLIDFKPFTKSDWYAWSGCEAESPMYGETREIGADYMTAVILDGEQIIVMDVRESDGEMDSGRFYRLTSGAGF